MPRTTALASIPVLLAVSALWVTDSAVPTSTPQPGSTQRPESPAQSDAKRRGRAEAAFDTHAPFVPNLGQWPHAAAFVHRSGPVTVFLEPRGWTLDLANEVAIGMTFRGSPHRPGLVGERPLPGHHNYFLGADERRWRTAVPLYSSVRYEELYPGIDLRFRRAEEVAEYDLLLRPGADLSLVDVHVAGAEGLAIARDGSLVITTGRGTLTQPRPRTWKIAPDGQQLEVACDFTILADDRFGFVAPDWDGTSRLTIDPGLIWSSFAGGSSYEQILDAHVHADGHVTVAGYSLAPGFPTTPGVYGPTHNGNDDAVVCRFDPAATGNAQLVYSTFVGGSGGDRGQALSVGDGGEVVVTGSTQSANFPTRNAFDDTYNSNDDAFVFTLDPNRSGAAQLRYATFLGGNSIDLGHDVHVGRRGWITVTGRTLSADFPTTSGAFDTARNDWDVFVTQLEPSQSPANQMVYSTYLGGSRKEWASNVHVNDNATVFTVAGFTESTNFPTTPGAFDTTAGGTRTGFVSQIDVRGLGSAGLVYSTYLGDALDDRVSGLDVDGDLLTVTGHTRSTGFPTTAGAYDTTHNGGFDAFAARLDLRQTGNAQLIYSTFLGGLGDDRAFAMVVTDGTITLAGETYSFDFPTTPNAYDRNKDSSSDAFAARLDPRLAGLAQLTYGSFLGGGKADAAHALTVDASGTATIAGGTLSDDLPTTSGAFDTTYNGSRDMFVSRLRMDSTFYADRHELPLTQAGLQEFRLEAGAAYAGMGYAIFGSATGTTPGINLTGVHIPLNIDIYTRVTIGSALPPIFNDFRGTLDGTGAAQASFRVPANLPGLPGITLHHVYIVVDGTGRFRMASNAVRLRLH